MPHETEEISAIQAALHPRQAGPRAVKIPEGTVPSRPPWEEKPDLLDVNRRILWERTLHKNRREQWEEIKAMLIKCGPEMRMQIISFILQEELAHARQIYQVCVNVKNQPYKADCISTTSREFIAAIKRLEIRLGDVFPFIEPMNRLLLGLASEIMAVDAHYRLVDRVCGTDVWAEGYPGVAEGKGLSAYDNEKNVEKARVDAKAAHEAYLERHKELVELSDEKSEKVPKKKGRKKASNTGQQTI